MWLRFFPSSFATSASVSLGSLYSSLPSINSIIFNSNFACRSSFSEITSAELLYVLFWSESSILSGSYTTSGMLRLVFNIGINNCSAMADINKSTTSLRYLDSTHSTVNSNVHENIVIPILLRANTLGNDSRFEYSCSARPRIILITLNCPLLIVVISTSIKIVDITCIGRTNGAILVDVK